MCLNCKKETWSMTFGKGQQRPRCTVRGQSGISRGKGFQESSDTHLLEALQAYLIQVWQQQGGLCYPWRFSSALHGSRSVILVLGNFQLYFSATWPPRLLSPPCAWGHKAKEQGVPVGSSVFSGGSRRHCWYWEMCTCRQGVSHQQMNHARVSSPMSQAWPHPQQSWSHLSQMTTWEV